MMPTCRGCDGAYDRCSVLWPQGRKCCPDCTHGHQRGLVAAQVVAQHLSEFTYAWSTERELQEAMWTVLADRFPDAQREAVLSPKDRPDFLVGVDGAAVAIEVKVAGSRNAILRQLGRYAAHDTVDAVVLASGRRVLAAGIPSVIHETPVLSTYLGSSL